MGPIGGTEILIILLVILLFFGAKKIPELARGIGQGMKEFKKASDDIKRELEQGEQEGFDGPKQQDNSNRKTEQETQN